MADQLSSEHGFVYPTATSGPARARAETRCNVYEAEPSSTPYPDERGYALSVIDTPPTGHELQYVAEGNMTPSALGKGDEEEVHGGKKRKRSCCERCQCCCGWLVCWCWFVLLPVAWKLKRGKKNDDLLH